MCEGGRGEASGELTGGGAVVEWNGREIGEQASKERRIYLFSAKIWLAPQYPGNIQAISRLEQRKVVPFWAINQHVEVKVVEVSTNQRNL